MPKFDRKNKNNKGRKNTNALIPDSVVRRALQEKGKTLTPEMVDTLAKCATSYFETVLSTYKDLIERDAEIVKEALAVLEAMAKNPDLTEEQRKYIIDKTVEIEQSHGMRVEQIEKVVRFISKVCAVVFIVIAILATGGIAAFIILLIFYLNSDDKKTK